MRRRLLPIILLAVMLTWASIACGLSRDTSALGWWAARGTEYMVSADHPLASRAGAQVLAEGGNAVDAAVATSFALGVVRPYSTGLGGGGFMMIKPPGELPVVVDFRERAAAACSPDKYLDENGDPVPGMTVRGAWAVGIPGTLKGMTYVLEHYGTKTLVEVIQPALELAEKGFPVDKHTRAAMAGLVDWLDRHPDAAGNYHELARTFLRNGRPYGVGDTLRRPQLAASLRLIAEDGADALYDPAGKLHKRLVGMMSELHGPITSADLAGYEITIREPLSGSFMGYETWTMPPPSSGGAVITAVLNAVDRYEQTGLVRDALAENWPHFLVECLKHAFADRAAGLGDWDFDPDGQVHKLVKQMIDPSTAQLVIDDFKPDDTYRPDHYGTGKLADDRGTSHYCVLDSAGMAVACTETINLEFGSYVMVPGTGIVLNNQLDDFSIKSGVANQFGLVQSDANLIGPGKRPLSSMSPTIITKDDRPVLIVGGSGGPRIITGTLEVILNKLRFGMRSDRAVAAPRFHHQWQPDVVYVEEDINGDLVLGLIKRGHRVGRYPSSPGHIQMIYRTDEEIIGVADPRKGGKPAGE